MDALTFTRRIASIIRPRADSLDGQSTFTQRLSRFIGPPIRRLLDAPFQAAPDKRAWALEQAHELYDHNASADEQIVVQDSELVEETETGYWVGAILYIPKDGGPGTCQRCGSPFTPDEIACSPSATLCRACDDSVNT